MAETNPVLEKMLTAGKCVIQGEWLTSKPETINYNNAKTGKASSFSRISHTLLIGNEAVKVAQPVLDGVNPESVVVPFKRGDRVVVEVDSMEIAKGNRSIRAVALTKL